MVYPAKQVIPSWTATTANSLYGKELCEMLGIEPSKQHHTKEKKEKVWPIIVVGFTIIALISLMIYASGHH